MPTQHHHLSEEVFAIFKRGLSFSFAYKFNYLRLEDLKILHKYLSHKIFQKQAGLVHKMGSFLVIVADISPHAVGGNRQVEKKRDLSKAPLIFLGKA